MITTKPAASDSKYTKSKFTKRPRRPFFKKNCSVCAQGMSHVDYKNTEFLKTFTYNNGRIIARRSNGLCAKHQRAVTNAIKRARSVALMAFVKE